MNSKNNSTTKIMPMQIDLYDNYDRKALTFINGNTQRGLVAIKKSYVDKRRRGADTISGPIKAKYTIPFKKARAKIEFNDYFDMGDDITMKSGRRWKTYEHDFNSKTSVNLKQLECCLTPTDCVNRLIPIVENRIKHYDVQDDFKYQWLFSTAEKKYNMSTKANKDINVVNKEIKEKLLTHANKYLVSPIKSLQFVRRYCPTALAGQVGKSDLQAKKTWLEKSPNTKFHCGYASLLIARNGKYTKKYIEDAKNNYDSSILSQHIVDFIDNFKKWLQNPKNKDIVGDYKLAKSMVDKDTLHLLAKYMKRPIIVYDNLYARREEWCFHGAPKSKATIRKNKKNGTHEKPIELRLKHHGSTNHFHALIRWKDIENLGYNYEEQIIKEVEQKEEKEKQEAIITTKVFPKPINTKKLIAWDIEASPNKSNNNKFQTWAAGIAWINGKNKKCYEKFYGRDSLPQMMDFLYSNCEDFDGYVMYAHNGGSFDFTLLMNDCLLNHDKWRLNTSDRAPIEQGGSWISVNIETMDKKSGRKFSLTMRDSMRMLPGSLDNLTRELKVKHQKLPETINHDEIAAFMNANQFDTTKLLLKYPQIEKYLLHDCVGLLEVVSKFRGVS